MVVSRDTTHPNFAMFSLESGNALGMWSKHSVVPAAVGTPGAMEVAFGVADKEAVESIYRTWSERGVRIVQHPPQMDFGYTFVGLDPDEDRLRVFAANPSA